MDEGKEQKPGEDKKSRRRRLRNAVLLLRQRAEQVDGLADRVSGVVSDVREVVEGTDARELLSARARRRLEQAAERLEESKERTAWLVDACDRVQKALQYADQALSPGFPLGAVALAAGIVVASVVIAAAVILAIGVTVLIDNRNCGRITLSGVANFVPGIDIPDKIDSGEVGAIRVPRTFRGNFIVEGDVLTVSAFGRDIPVSVNRLDLAQSVWNNTPLEVLQGNPVSVNDERENQLTLWCNQG
jgi:hypothetical protein